MGQNLENLSTNEDGKVQNQEWESLSSLADKMEAKRGVGEKTQLFLERAGFTEIRKDKEAWEDFLQGLNIDTAIAHLGRLNGLVKNIPIKQRGPIEDPEERVFVGDLTSAFPDSRRRILERGLEAIKNLDDDRKRASLAYYLINNLHMFSDGNGRTSRAVFTILNDENFDFGRDQWIMDHNAEKDIDAVAREEFAERNNIVSPDAGNIDGITSYINYKNYVKEGKIDKIFSGLEYLNTLGSTRLSQKGYHRPHIPESINEQLTNVERAQFIDVITDHTGSKIQVGGIAMAVMLSRKGIAEKTLNDPRKVIQGVNEDKLFRVTFKLRTEDFFDDWDPQDCIETISVGKRVKEDMFDVLIDVFEHEDKYKMKDGRNLIDGFLNANTMNYRETASEIV